MRVYTVYKYEEWMCLGTLTQIVEHFGCVHLKKSLCLGSINNTISQSVDASVLVDSDKGSHCRMLLCTLKIRLFRVESKGFHIINLASHCPHNH